MSKVLPIPHVRCGKERKTGQAVYCIKHLAALFGLRAGYISQKAMRLGITRLILREVECTNSGHTSASRFLLAEDVQAHDMNDWAGEAKRSVPPATP